MLNFNRFKYRRKACLDFYSPTRNKSGFQPESNSKQLGFRKEKTDSKDDCIGNYRECDYRKGQFSFNEESSSGESSSSKNERSFSSETKTESTDNISKLGEKRSPSNLSRENDKIVMTGEERLSSILCNGLTSYAGKQEDDDHANVQVISRKRKEPLKESPCKVSNQPKSKTKFNSSNKPLDCYESFKPKSKKKKFVMLDNSSGDEDIKSDTVSMKKGEEDVKSATVGAKKGEELNDSLEDDVEKLREIYSHLSVSQAKEAIGNAGSLVDAILSLADTLDIEGDNEVNDSGEIKKEKLKKPKKQKTRKTRRVIIDESDDDHGVASPKKVVDLTKSSKIYEVASKFDDNDDEEDDDDYDYGMTEEQSSIWSFFQEASVADIGTVPGCSEKRAAEIIKHRPFDDYNDLVSKVSKLKGISVRIVEDSIDFINEQAEVEKLLIKCQKISKNISKAIRSQPKRNEAENPTETVFEEDGLLTQQPSILNSSFELKHYQLSGLNWLVTLHNEGVNGILADQMGLGKTIQALAFLGYLIENGNTGPHVIIVPSSTCDNWLREIETWLPTVSYVQYKGSQEERFALKEEILYGEEEYNIIISTYNIAISTAKDRSLFRKLKSHYLILDEGHMLKNMKSNRYKYLMDIKSTRRLLLTGTPLQNNLLEMISLLSFLMPDFFAERINGISMLFGSKSQSSYQERIIETAKKILKPFILRRTKGDVLKDLPKKVEKLTYCELTQKQRMYYDALVAKYKSLDGIREDYKSALTIIMSLRKISNHPLLERNLYDKDLLTKMARDYCDQLENRESCVENVLEDMEVMSDFELHNLCREKYYLIKYCLQTEAILNSGKFKQLDKLLPELKEKGCRVLLFSQFTTILDIAVPYLKHKKYKYLRLDGQTPVSERQSLIDEYNNNEDLFIFLLSTRAGGVGINLTAANVVIMHDIDFNPYNDKQAEDRCHRVGQKRDVTVYKLISKDTIEEGILKCANSKLHLEQNVAGNIGEDDSSSEDIVKYLMANIS